MSIAAWSGNGSRPIANLWPWGCRYYLEALGTRKYVTRADGGSRECMAGFHPKDEMAPISSNRGREMAEVLGLDES